MSEKTDNFSVDEILEGIRNKRSGETDDKTDIAVALGENEESYSSSNSIFDEIELERPDKKLNKSVSSEAEKSLVTNQIEIKETEIEISDDSFSVDSFITEDEVIEEPEELKADGGVNQEAVDKEDGEAYADGTSSAGDDSVKENEPSFKAVYDDRKKNRDDGKTKVFKREGNGNEIKLSEKTKVSVNDEDGEIPEFEKKFNEDQKQKIENFRIFTSNLSDNPVYDKETEEALSVLDAAKPKGGEDIFKAVEKAKKPKKENVKKSELLRKRNSKVYDKIDVGRVKLELKKTADRNKLRMVILVISLVLCLAAEIVKAIYVGGSLASAATVMRDKSIIFYIIELVLSVPVLGVSLEMFITRLRNSEKFAFTNELAMLVISVFNLAHTAVLTAVNQEISKTTMFFTTAVLFTVLITVLGDIRENRMILRNLETISKNERIMGVYSLDRDTDKLASGISNSREPVILCSGEVEVPNSFMDSSTIKDKQNGYLKVIIPCMLAFSAVCAAIAYITYASVTALSTAFISTLLLCSPAIISFVLISLLSEANTHLNRSGCQILGYEAVEYIDDTDAIVLDTADVFTGEISRFHIINTKTSVDTLTAFEIACAVIEKSDGVLKSDVLKFKQEQELVLPEVEDLKYEERMGLSCWVDGKCTLLGNRRMMEEHNLALPPAYTEEGYINDGKKVFYLAVDSQVIAMFCAEYFIGRQAKKQLERLYKTGIILMIMTTDPNIDEAFAARTLGVDVSSIKTVGSAGTQTIKKSIDETAKQKRTGLIFKKNVSGLLRVINTAFRLYDVQSLALLIQTISIGFAFAVMAVLNLVATSYFANVWLIIVYHILWIVLSNIMTKRTKNE